MAIERELTTEQYTALPDGDKDLYSETATDGKHLFIGENAGALKRAKDRVADEKRELAKQLAEYREKEAAALKAKEQAEHRKAVASEDSSKLDERWKKKYDKDLGEASAKLNRLQQTIKKQFLDRAIDKEVDEISRPKFKHLIRPLYEKRVTAELNDADEARLIIKDQYGNPSEATINDLTNEFKADKRNEDIFKGEVLGSGTTGSQAPVETQTAGGKKPSPTHMFKEYYDYKTLTPAEKVSFLHRK